ncbi:MAG: hypothetical protein IH991_21960 [Planctomycetes bacterium]|nr:hypothetical protein [Planctomycetota bacterium]
MERISLRKYATSDEIMRELLADEFFVSDDDLEFYPTDDPLLSAEQRYTEGETKRQSHGAYSWMATVVPKFLDPSYDPGPDNRWGVANFDDDLVNGPDDFGERLWPGSDDTHRPTDLYTLSIVVYYHREVASTDAERVSEVVGFHSAGFGGGDLTIEGTTADDVDVNQRDWVMLSQTIPTSSVRVPVHKWYRVTAVDTDTEEIRDPITNVITSFHRHITVIGRDIDPKYSTDPNFNIDPTNKSYSTQVTLAKGVVAVYEKTIRLESSSLWIP